MFRLLFIVTVHSLKLEIGNWKFILSYFCAVDKRIPFLTKFSIIILNLFVPLVKIAPNQIRQFFR